jgi:hypothetical protein
MDARKHMETLLARLGNQTPSLDDAAEVAALSNTRPDLPSVPDLERTSLIARLKSARDLYWHRFWALEKKRLSELARAPKPDLQAIAARLSKLSAPGMAPEYTTVRVPLAWNPGDPRDGGSFLYAAQMLLADARAAAGTAPMPLELGGDRAPCDRLHSAGLLVEIPALELVFSLPVDYWSPTALESMRASLERCHPNAPEALRTRYTEAITVLDGALADIQRHVSNRELLLTERKRQMDLPKTVASIRATGFYSVRREDQRSRDIRDDRVARFFEPGMAAHREAVQSAAIAEIGGAFAIAKAGAREEEQAKALCSDAHELPEPVQQACRSEEQKYVKRIVAQFVTETQQRIEAAPRNLESLKRLMGYQVLEEDLPRSIYELKSALTAARGAFEEKIQPLRSEAVLNAKREIEAAFRAARPRQASEEAAMQMCQLGRLSSPELTAACGAALQAYLELHAPKRR